jgi:hypothetical protein
MANSGTSDFDVELCHAFINTVARSDLICPPFTKDLIERYLHSKWRNNLIFKVYTRIAELDRPFFVNLLKMFGGPRGFQRAAQSLDDAAELEGPRLSHEQAPDLWDDAAGPKPWDCVDNED